MPADQEISTAALWEGAVPPDDLAAMRAAGYGARQGLGERPAVLVIDANYAFTGDAPDELRVAIGKRRTACGRTAWEAVDAIAVLLKAARDQAIPIFYSTGRADRSGAEIGRWAGKNSRVVEDSAAGADPLAIHAAIAPLPDDQVIAKSKPSFFFGTDLLARLIELSVDSLLVVGGTTSGCVRASVLDAFSYNFRTAVIAEGTFDRSDISHRVTLFDLQAKYVDVITLREATDYCARLDR